VRRAAFPLVERAIVALQTLPRDAVEVNRFVDIMSRSHLAEDRKQEIVDRLLNDQASGDAVHQAMERWFEGSGDELRSDLVDVLDSVWSGLQHGAPGDAAVWVLEDGRRVDLSSVENPAVAARAEGLVYDLTGRLASSPLQAAQPELAERVRGFCRDVYLAVRIAREEEEEEHSSGAWAPVEEG
jgi:hypothetical protein